MDFIRTYSSELALFGFGLAQTCAVFVVLETLLPRVGARPSIGSRLKAIVFWMVYGAVIIMMAHALTLVWAPLGVKPLFAVFGPASWPPLVKAALGVVAAAYIGDLVYYWCHRIQHRFFWRFHAVHHSVREMSGVTAYHHVSEELFQFALYSIPLSLLVDSPYSIPIVGVLLAQQGNYLHSPTRVNFGPLGRYFVDNRFHRIHHSIEQRHFDKNFGLFTTLWDSVFGTAYFPEPGEWPETGVADFAEPRSVVEYLLAPFSARWHRVTSDDGAAAALEVQPDRRARIGGVEADAA
jgi:sterol desaturase/sphingolipid hydroxylase (fatty acid hydroxylase superfamily)